MLAAVLVGAYWFISDKPSGTPQVLGEIEEIMGGGSLDEQVKSYTRLIERMGPEQAQDALLSSGLPFTGQTHLLNHTVGDWLYEKFGAAGLTHCREYFLASCYHGFTLHAIASGGMEEVKKVMAECEKSGRPVVVQCSHAVGHGFLTTVGYSQLLGGLELCDDASRRIADFPLYNCHDGVFMENIWGVHEGKPSPERWVKTGDLVYPCNDPRIPVKYLNACWSNQPAHIYQQTSGSLKAIGQICLTIEKTDHRQTCFNGLSRQIHPLTKGQAAETFELCAQLPPLWVDYCVNTIAISDFSVGGRDLSFRLCAQTRGEVKNECYNGLFGIMNAYAKNADERRGFCDKILETNWKEACYNVR